MKLPYSLYLLAGLAAFTAGCSKNDKPASAAAPTPTPMPNSAPAAGAGAKSAAARSITIEGNDAMKFSVMRIEANANEDLTIVLTNVGTLPKEAMGHNWILLRKGADVNAYSVAAMTAKATDFIPASQAAQVIAHTKLLGPKQTDQVTFKVPAEPGEYPYLCSFPAHAMAGMKGVLVVK